MLFSLSNALPSFQDYINKILAENLDVFIMVYLDNIPIYIEDAGQDNVKAVRYVFGELQNLGLFTDLKKCRFHREEVCFLGYIVSS